MLTVVFRLSKISGISEFWPLERYKSYLPDASKIIRPTVSQKAVAVAKLGGRAGEAVVLLEYRDMDDDTVRKLLQPCNRLKKETANDRYGQYSLFPAPDALCM